MFKKIIGFVLIICALCFVGYYEHNYTRKDCEIIQVNNGIVTFEDKCGLCWNWEIEPNEYFEIGECVDLKMYDNCSSGYVHDDEITKVIFHD